jgi:hypothetical protein
MNRPACWCFVFSFTRPTELSLLLIVFLAEVHTGQAHGSQEDEFWYHLTMR